MSDTTIVGGEIVWRPAAADIERAQLTRFMRAHNIATYDELMRRSTADVAWFTAAILDYLDIQFQTPYTQVVDLSRGIQWPRWCVGGQLNIVHNCVDKWAADPATRHRTALVWEGEEGGYRRLTYGELAAEVGRCANALRGLGLGKGDSIGLFMPMTPEIVVALLAVARIGGVILPLFSGYGAGAVASRLADAGARALITADGLPRRGQIVPLKPTADEAAAQVPSLAHMLVVRRTGNEVPMTPGRDHWWHELLPGLSPDAPLEPTAAEDLLMIIYTSGTTGRPKGAVHTHCGFPVKAAQDMAFGTDVGAADSASADTIYWMTDMGWMMGPWLIFGATLLGATAFIYDGAPDYPNVDRLWALVERHRITQLGVSPTLIRALAPYGAEPVKRHDLSSLRLFASTGEPWNPDPWLWLFNVVGEGQRPIINYSGGTEIGGGILMGNPILPQKPTAFSAACPGMAADVVDAQGRSVRNAVGELVVRAPWIGMTRGFWRDDQRYLDTYWSQFDNVWVHGDWAAIDDDGMWYILGRSDDTIKVAGKRLGPAEVESVLVNHPAVSEAAVVGVPDPLKGSAVVCFCVLVAGVEPSDELAAELRRKVATELGKPLQPKAIHFVDDLPKTRNAKVMRRVIRSAYLGEDPGDTSSLVNPASVDTIRDQGSPWVAAGEGKMTQWQDNPNALQQVARRVVSLAPVSAVLSRTLHHLDGPILRWSDGRFSAASLVAGLPIISLTTTGAKTGQPRTVPLIAIPDGRRLILIASNWGRPRHPSWYHNLKANPQVAVTVGGETATWTARELTGEARDAAWRRAVALYPGYAQYARRNGGLPIPVIELQRPQAT